MFDFISRLWHDVFGYKLRLGPVTINAMDYLVERDASGAFLTTGTTLVSRRHDWPGEGYQYSESVMMQDGRVLQTMCMMNPVFIGGQILSVRADGYVRIESTKDGGTPWVQYFVGGTGWIAFGNDAKEEQWTEVMATLADVPDPRKVPPAPLNYAYTRYRLTSVGYAGMPYPIPTVVSEHYNARSMGEATAMERSYFARGIGLIRWEAWSQSPPAIGDLPVRNAFCSFTRGRPFAGWQLNDVRQWTIRAPVLPTAVPSFHA